VCSTSRRTDWPSVATWLQLQLTVLHAESLWNPTLTCTCPLHNLSPLYWIPCQVKEGTDARELNFVLYVVSHERFTFVFVLCVTSFLGGAPRIKYPGRGLLPTSFTAGLISSSTPPTNFYAFLIGPTRAIWSSHHILFHLITIVTPCTPY
jgi:hypothetical protein